MNRDAFFPALRATLFQGRMSQDQVDGVNALLDAAPDNWDSHWLAYALATAFHETNQTMQPVREAYWQSELWRKQHLRYWPFYGRGFVQLTWQANYRSMGAIVGRDLVKIPDQALELPVAAQILFYGMEHGSFTGKKLTDYINAAGCDFINARRIINGTDCAAQIASYAQTILAALSQ